MNIKKLTLPLYVLCEVQARLANTKKDDYYWCTVPATEIMHMLEDTFSDGWYLYCGETFFRCLGKTYIPHDLSDDVTHFNWTLEQFNHRYLNESDATLIKQLTGAGCTLSKQVRTTITGIYQKDKEVKAHAKEIMLMRQNSKKRLKLLREKIALIKAANPWKEGQV